MTKTLIRTLREDDLDALFALRRLSFLDCSDFTDEAVRARHRARLPYSYGHFLEGELTSAAVCFPFEMFLAGQRVRAGGLASVLSAPETRRRGFVRELLGSILAALREDGVGWALEYPFDPAFYARYGFATVPTGCEVTVPAAQLFRGAAPDAVRVVGDPAPQLDPIYERWAPAYALTLSRREQGRPTWHRILSGARFSYLLEDAYAVLELEENAGQQTLVVHDYAFASPAGREGLWRFVGSFYGQVERISLHLPQGEPLAFDLQRHHTNQLPLLQARVVDLGAALRPLRRPAEYHFTLGVRDPFCSPNDGAFEVTLGPTGASVAPSTRPPELSLSVGTLTQLLTGALSAEAAGRAGLLQGDGAVAQALAALGAGRTTFMPSSDYF